MKSDQTHSTRDCSRARGGLPGRLGVLFLALVLASTLAACQDPAPPGTPLPSDPTPMDSSPTPEITAIEATNTPLPSSTPQPTATFDISTVEDWGVGRLIFDLEEHSFGEKISLGIYALDLADETLTEIIPGAQLLDISPDRQRILAAAEEELRVMDLVSGSYQVLAENYYALSPSGAKWDPAENRVYYLTEGDSGVTLHWVQPDSGEGEQLASDSPIAVLEADQGVIVLGKGSCNPFGECTYSGQEWISKAGEKIAIYDHGETIMMPCQKPDQYVYAEKDQDGYLTLHIKPHGQDQETVFWATKPEYSDCDWAPDGSRLAVTLVDRFWYSGSIQDYYFQILVPNTNEVIDRSYLKAPLDHVVWSPDGRYVVFTGTGIYEDIYQVEINLMELNSLSVRRYNHLNQLRSGSYLTIPSLFWAP